MSGGLPPFHKGGFWVLTVSLLLQRPLLKGAVSRRLTEDCVLRSKTYEVNKVLQTLFISYISPAAKYNPPPQFANWGTSFLKEAFRRKPDRSRSKGPLAKGGWHGEAVTGGFPTHPSPGRAIKKLNVPVATVFPPALVMVT